MKKAVVAFLLTSVLMFGEEYKACNESWLDSFSLESYKKTYIIPVSYYDHPPNSYVNTTEFQNLEVEVQFSMKYRFSDQILGLNEQYYIAYTHHSFWQLYAYSKPFRENIYNPELFVRFPVDQWHTYNLKMIQIGYEHQSNGQYNTENVQLNGVYIGNISRGVDTLYTTFRFSEDDLYVDLKFWYPLGALDDNPDIMQYYGYSSLHVRYYHDKQMLSAMMRGNILSRKGAVELQYDYPLKKSVNLFVKGFSGYVDTLIDYDRKVNKIGIGFSFSN